jgi:hypothetical protein
MIRSLIFFSTLGIWNQTRLEQQEALLKGQLNPKCDSANCKIAQALIKFGPISQFGPWAKACGNCLNFNCSLILLPIVRMLLRYINNVGTSFSRAQKNATLFARLFAHPMTR